MSRRLHRALISGNEELFQVLLDPSMEVLQAAIRNPAIDENHLLVLLNRRDLTEELLKGVARLPRVAESHRLKVALVRNASTPGPVVLTLLPHLHLFELVNICQTPGVTPDQRVAAERAIIQRLPTTPLGNKLTLAHRGTPAVLEALIKEGEPRLVDTCLNNPRLREAAIYQFLNGPAATAETISAVARNPRWKAIPSLRLAILKNYRTPLVWFTVFLPGLGAADLRNLLASRRLTAPQKQAVQQEMKRRGL